MQENLFYKQSRLISIFVRLGLPLALGILAVLLPIDLVSSTSRSPTPASLPDPDHLSTTLPGTLDLGGKEAVEQPESPTAASDIGWNALPNRGLNSRVRAFALGGVSLYMGGRFTQTDDGFIIDLGNITRYDTLSSTWNALPNQGLSDEVTALAVVDSDLYSGGSFTQTVDGAVPNLGYIAHYDTTGGTWNALSKQGLNNLVFAMVGIGNDLYTGGVFTQTGDGSLSNLGRIARYDTTASSWNALPNQGLNGNVYSLAVSGSDVYVGGGFSQTGDGTLTNLGNIARYDSTSGTWIALPNQGLDGQVNALAVSGSDVYVGGYFTQTADGTVTNLSHIARYDSVSGSWHALPNQGLNDGVFSFAELGNDIYIGGAFDQTGDGFVTNLGYIASYDTVNGTWYALPNQGLGSWVYALTVINSDLYTGGEFNQAGDGMVPDLGHIARFGNIDIKVYLPLVIKQ